MLDFGQTWGGPLIEQIDGGETFSTTSLVSVQPLASITVSRRVAEAEDTWAVVISELGASIVAAPLTTLQVVDEMGWRPGVAEPFKVKAVAGPSRHRV